MKQALISGIFTIIAFSSASARLGESEKEIIARYGAGKLSDKQRQPGAKTYIYFKNQYQIEVVIYQGISIWEIIHRKNVKGVFTDKEAETVLDVYKEMKRKWRYDRRDKRWESSGKPKYVAYLWPGHKDFLCSKDIVACETLDKVYSGKGL